MTEFIPKITEGDIKQLSNPQSFDRGRICYHSGALFEAVRQGNELRAYCEGSDYQPYQGEAWDIYIKQFREEYRHLPALQDELNKAGL